MTEKEFEEFCREHGACNVDIDGEIEVSFALDLLGYYYTEHPDGAIPRLRDVFNQINRIHEITNNFNKGAEYENGTAFGNRHGITERSD